MGLKLSSLGFNQSLVFKGPVVTADTIFSIFLETRAILLPCTPSFILSADVVAVLLSVGMEYMQVYLYAQFCHGNIS